MCDVEDRKTGGSCEGYVFFFFKHKTAYEMRISDWSSDVCSSDLACRYSRMTRSRTRARTTWTASTPNCSAVTRTVLVVAAGTRWQLGRASRRERVCQYVSVSVVGVLLKKQPLSSTVWTTNLHR